MFLSHFRPLQPWFIHQNATRWRDKPKPSVKAKFIKDYTCRIKQLICHKGYGDMLAKVSHARLSCKNPAVKNPRTCSSHQGHREAWAQRQVIAACTTGSWSEWKSSGLPAQGVSPAIAIMRLFTAEAQRMWCPKRAIFAGSNSPNSTTSISESRFQLTWDVDASDLHE